MDCILTRAEVLKLLQEEGVLLSELVAAPLDCLACSTCVGFHQPLGHGLGATMCRCSSLQPESCLEFTWMRSRTGP